VEAVRSDATVEFADAELTPGHVRLRKRVGATAWDISCFDGAAILR